MKSRPTLLLPFVWGLVSGLPLALTSTVLQAWLTTEGYSMATVGFVSSIGLPYSVKMLWSPLFDRPGVTAMWGLRRGWLLVLQLALVVGLTTVALAGLVLGPIGLSVLMLVIVWLSASQDIVIDAWRAEKYAGALQPGAAAAYVSAYRIAMWLCGGLGLAATQWIGFRGLYGLAAGVLLLAMVATYVTVEPIVTRATQPWQSSIVDPLRALWHRPGISAVLVVALLYKLGDAMAAALATPFLLQRGYSLSQIGLVAQGIGLWATVGGALIGGWALGRVSVATGLWAGGILQAVSTVGYVVLANSQPDVWRLTLVVCAENATAGIGTAAFLSYLAGQARQPYTATQYALLSSIAAVPRTVFATGSGVLQAAVGWSGYFWLCALAALPGLLALMWWQRSATDYPVTAAVPPSTD